MSNNTENYTKRILQQALKGHGARLGLAWIGFLAIIAALAPLLANSHPLLLSIDGQLDSPMLAHLTAIDVTLFLSLCLALTLYFIPVSAKIKITAFFSALIIVSTLAHIFIAPPTLTVYEQYRESETQNTYDWVLRAPIPFSAKDYLRDSVDAGFSPPIEKKSTYTHLFGTEENGADVLSRMIHAARVALGIGFVATGIALLMGVLIGGLMGYFSGIIDILGMRAVEIFEAIPTLFLLLTFVAFFGQSLYLMMAIIGITSWPIYARYVRAEFLKLRKQEFVLAAIASGLPLRSILFRHMLPNGIAPALVAASFGVAAAILAESTLSFLGLGLVDDPSWGQMLNQAVRSSTFNWWMAIFPGGAIFLTVLAYNLLGEALRDAIDPRLR